VGANPGTPKGAAVGRLVAKLAAEELPGPVDCQAMIPPTRTAWVRRVPGENIWLWFTFDDVAINVVTLTDSPPMPLL
jgi:hypothetical protein